jgi:hypothetical protein
MSVARLVGQTSMRDRPLSLRNPERIQRPRRWLYRSTISACSELSAKASCRAPVVSTDHQPTRLIEARLEQHEVLGRSTRAAHRAVEEKRHRL